MTNIAFEDSKLRHELHTVTNCLQALYGYCELGEYQKARVISSECVSTMRNIQAELDALIVEEH